ESLETASPLTVVVPAGQNVPNNNFGYVLGGISGTAYTDVNTNSTYDAGTDTTLSGVTVTPTGPRNGTLTTSANAQYSFTGLPAGTYKVSVPSTAAGEALETASPLTVTVPAGGNVPNNNFGYVLGSISGLTYTDVNTNGTYEAGTDTLLSGVTV